jgi:hypothetical protein
MNFAAISRVRQGREIIRKRFFGGNRFEKRGGAVGFGLRFVVSPVPKRERPHLCWLVEMGATRQEARCSELSYISPSGVDAVFCSVIRPEYIETPESIRDGDIPGVISAQ